MLRRSRGMARTMGRTAVIAGTASAVSGHVARRQHARYAGQVAAEAPLEPAPPHAAGPDVIDQLRQFADLRDQGILTEEEFAAQKAKLLNA